MNSNIMIFELIAPLEFFTHLDQLFGPLAKWLIFIYSGNSLIIIFLLL